VTLSDLALTEVTSALARRMRDGSLSPAQARQIYRRMLDDVAAGLFRHLDLLRPTHRAAERLLLASQRSPLRGADALHLALALESGAACVLTFDRAMAAAARESGLSVWPPSS